MSRPPAILALAKFIRLWLAAVTLVAVMPAFAYDFGGKESGIPNETPKELKDIGITENLGRDLDLDLTFQDESGATLPLRTFFKTGKPVILSLAYYNCPGLCSFHLNGVNDMLRNLKWTTGNEFEFVVVSIDPSEKPDLAAEKKATYIEAYGRPEGAKGWHFLTGSQENIAKLAATIGFKYRWDDEQKQWAHASAAVIVTPGGTISRYLHGIVFDPKTVRLSLVEASSGLVGSIVDTLILYCFHFDPKANQYTVAAFNVARAGGVAIVAVLAMFMIPFWFRQRKEASSLQGEI